jgi:D-alanyl-D-alanine carboxypeptidase
MYLPSLILIVLCPAIACGMVPLAENMSTQPMIVNSVRETKDLKQPTPFYEALAKALKKRKTKLETLCPPSDPVARRILEDYGAIFLAGKKVTPPPVCVFTNEDQVTKFQDAAGSEVAVIGYDEVELQPEAMKQLNKAREEAQKEGLDITPRDGAEAARRNYEDSVRLWNSRFQPALDYWLSKGRLTQEEVTRLRNLPLSQQVAEVLELEKTGIYFSKDLSKSILYSIAAPGTSQHIAMLAFDVNEFENPRVREIMAKHGWFQTVLSDLPHFTFLGLKEKDLPKHGLRSLEINGQMFWIPNVVSLHPGLDK